MSDNEIKTGIDIVTNWDPGTQVIDEVVRAHDGSEMDLPQTRTDEQRPEDVLHVGLQELIDAAPACAFEDLPYSGVIITATGSIVIYDKSMFGSAQFGGLSPYAWLMSQEPLRLIHVGVLAMPTEEETETEGGAA